MHHHLPILSVTDGVPMADSREVAATFGKQHKHVLEAIRDCHCSDGFRRSHFRPFKIKDLTGESTSHVLMDRSGFAFVVLGFTGAPAAVFREAYIEAFDAMEVELRRQSPAIPQTLPEALRLAADLAEAVARKDERIAVLEPQAVALTTIAETEGTFCIRDAAKMLDTSERGFRSYLASQRWIYRRGRAEPWVAHQERINQGYMRTKVVAVETGTGKPWNRPQARITSRGLTILAQRLGKPVPPEAQATLYLPAPSRA